MENEMEQEYVITGIVEDAPDGEQYGCGVNGEYKSGYSSKSRGENGRVYQAIQSAIEGEAVVEPYAAHVDTYDDKRRKEYPPTGDQLDAIWKQLDTMELTAETKIVADEIQAVKDRWPKSIELLAK